MAGYVIAGGGRVSPHFVITEFSCDGYIYIDPDFLKFVENLERFREWYNRPININSGFRTARKNAEVGGDANSLHLKARAIDFTLPPEWKAADSTRRAEFVANIKKKWFDVCRRSGAYGQITYHKTGWIHMGMSFVREHYEERAK